MQIIFYNKIKAIDGRSVKIAFFSTQKFEPAYYNSVPHDIEFFDMPLNADTAWLINKHEVVCAFVNDNLDEACINVLQKKAVKLIALRCSAYNQVNLAACQQAQIKVVNVPQYSPHAVAEHALALLLCLNRKIHKAYTRIKEGNFELNGLQGINLYRKTIGIIGVGAIGKVFARIGHGLGCKILAYDPIKTKISYIEWTSLDTLISSADIISLHCPLNSETQHIINAQSFKLMKKNVLLINTGRGALIDSEALIDALKKQNIAGAAIDVYEWEGGIFYFDHSMDIIQDDALMRLTTFPNVLITSHQGFLTHEALSQIAKITLDNIQKIEKKLSCKNLLV